MVYSIAEALSELVDAMPDVATAIHEERTRRYLERVEREMERSLPLETAHPRVEAAAFAVK